MIHAKDLLSQSRFVSNQWVAYQSYCENADIKIKEVLAKNGDVEERV